jgi:hypothetical protein
MTDDAYYWAITGRIPFDDEDTPYYTDLPATQTDALEQFHRHMCDGDPDRYAEHGLIITALFRSTEPIELVS